MIMKLSEHFTLAELTASAKGDALGIENIPSRNELNALITLCYNVLEPVRAHFSLILGKPSPVTVLSGFRCPELNKAVGGAPTSQHLNGEAADIEIKGIPNASIWEYIRDNINFDQVIAEKLSKTDGSAGWVHVSYSMKRQRRDAISFLGNGKYVPGLVFV